MVKGDLRRQIGGQPVHIRASQKALGETSTGK